jgi:putative membrane protein
MIGLLVEESLKEIERTVTEMEERTCAEMVVVIAHKSSHYRDVSFIGGALLALFSLCLILFSPLSIHHLMVIPDMLIFFFLGYFLTARIPALGRYLATPARCEAESKRAAQVAFFEQGVSATKERTGILFFASILERRIEILPDLGIDGRVHRGRWNELLHDMNNRMKVKLDVKDFTELLRKSGAILAEILPATGHNDNQIPNSPRVI